MADDDQLRGALDERPNILTRMKVPVWVPLAVTLVLIVIFVFLFSGKETVDLGNGVGGSRSIDVAICFDEQVFRDKKVKIPDDEEAFSEALRKLGAEGVQVRIRRTPDCPVVVPAVTTTTIRR